MDEENRSLRTQGLSDLTEKERQELIRLLKKAKIKHRAVHTEFGDEIDLLNINVSVSGVIPDIIKLIKGFGVELIDWIDR